MKLVLQDKEYKLLIGYRQENEYRHAFNDLAKNIFNISFEDWYQAGYWNEKYIPYTLFDGHKAIANASANIMDFNTFGESKRYIQIGTVMTDENYRNKGLSRFLIEKILNDWNTRCDFVYLYANSTVLDFYPKLGFTRVKEYECFKKIKKFSPSQFEKLNMNVQENRNKLYDYVRTTKVFGKLSMQENADLVMFYCITVLKDCVYFLKSLDTFAIAKFNNKQIHLLDVFSKNEINLNAIINLLSGQTTNSILLGFTPKDFTSFEIRHVDEALKDEVLFIKNDKTKLFYNNKIMYPLLSHA
jgi:GNAT superfamily N-acetyltransferase